MRVDVKQLIFDDIRVWIAKSSRVCRSEPMRVDVIFDEDVASGTDVAFGKHLDPVMVDTISLGLAGRCGGIEGVLRIGEKVSREPTGLMARVRKQLGQNMPADDAHMERSLWEYEEQMQWSLWRAQCWIWDDKCSDWFKDGRAWTATRRVLDQTYSPTLGYTWDDKGREWIKDGVALTVSPRMLRRSPAPALTAPMMCPIIEHWQEHSNSDTADSVQTCPSSINYFRR